MTPPFTWVKFPPANNVAPDRAREDTELFMSGSKPGTARPVEVSKEANRFLVVAPLTVVKNPPT
jgi:hypothetical protein